MIKYVVDVKANNTVLKQFDYVECHCWDFVSNPMHWFCSGRN